MIFGAVILAGGESSRMGRDKALLEVDGRTLLARQIALARSAGAKEVFVSGRPDTDYAQSGCSVLVDRFKQAGPLAGIERALDAITSPFLLVLAVDMPRLNAGLLNRIQSRCRDGRGAIPRVAGRIEPLAAFYPRAAHVVAVEFLEAPRDRPGMRTGGATDFARACVERGMAVAAEMALEDPGCFQSVNTPEELPR